MRAWATILWTSLSGSPPNLTCAKVTSCQPPPVPSPSRRPLLLSASSAQEVAGSAKNLGIILDSYFSLFHIPPPTANPTNMTFKPQPESGPTLLPLPFLSRAQLVFWPLDYCISLLPGLRPSTLAPPRPYPSLSMATSMI